METESETELPQQWALALDRNGQPEWFAERGIRVAFTWRLTKAAALEVSREIYPELWGLGDAKEHRGGFLVNLVVTVG
jgi:hypothetical protein